MMQHLSRSRVVAVSAWKHCAPAAPVRCFAAGSGGFERSAGAGKPHKKQDTHRRGPSSRGRDGNASSTQQQPQPQRPRKKKVFQFSKKGGDETPAPEVFENPAYWEDDFPAGFDDQMKHEVEKLQIFADFTPMMDLSWQKEIHPKFDGKAIEMIMNCPLEDFDERLFVEDKTTYDTKVVMEVPLSCFVGLDQRGVDFVTQLAGPRYNASKRSLKLTEDKYPTRVFNHKRLCDILRDLTETADQLSQEQQAQQTE